MLRRLSFVIAAVAALVLAATVPAVGAPPALEPGAAEAQACAVRLGVGAPAVVPAELVEVIAAGLADPRLDGGVGVGMSIWVEGYGVVFEQFPTLRLRPASNQKLLTAVAAFEVLGPDHRFDTRVVADGLVNGGVLDGDLFVVGGGDPTLGSVGAHSLATLAAAVRGAGITRITGDVVGDATRYDDVRRANGWSEAVAPTWVGALSALMVDENRWRADAPFLADPTRANAGSFLAALEAAGVRVDGGTRVGAAPARSVAVAGLRSAPLRGVVAKMLTDSDNTIAEMLVKELGFVRQGRGTTRAGLAVMDEVARDLCLPETVLQHDGSGLSHGNARSARAWRTLLQLVRDEPWFGDLWAALPVAGESGTLRFRFRDSAAAGNLRAKTGTITGIRALSGYLTLGDGRLAAFSVIIDAADPERARPAMAAIDNLLEGLAAFGAPTEE